jgi:hypothetical protein
MSDDEQVIGTAEEEEEEDGRKAKVPEDYSQRRFDELSKTLWRVSLVLVVFALFCSLSLAQPDASFIRSGGTVKMPFANVDISYGAFFIFGPIALAGVLLYLHILLEEWEKFGWYDYERRLIYVFNIPSLIPRLVTAFTFYLLGPIVLLGFAFKARASWNADWFWILIDSLVLLLLFLSRRAAQRWKIVVACVALTASFGTAAATRAMVFLFPLQIAGADLSKQDLRGSDLRGANASGSDLSSSVLAGMDLSKANFAQSNLEGAYLNNSRLTDANLQFANLRRANLAGSDARGVDFFGADLTDARLERANFSGSYLAETHGLTQDQLAYACGDEGTWLPSGLNLESCSR